MSLKVRITEPGRPDNPPSLLGPYALYYKSSKNQEPMSRFTDFNFEELNEFSSPDIQTLVSSRLEDMAEQIGVLVEQGRYSDANFLRNEGLLLAEYMDGDNTFFYAGDFAST